MENSLFFNNVEENDNNKDVIIQVERYIENNPTEQIYLITAPLGENKYHYEYENSVIVILSPKHKIIFLDLLNNKDDFDEYYEDFIEDLASISDKFNYKEHIGRPRKWKRSLTVQEFKDSNFSIEELLSKNRIGKDEERKIEFIISLLIGSINDINKIGVEEPETLLEKVKNKILLFDGEQSRFLYKKIDKKVVSIQGLSGTGKTELLLHKLKELYTLDVENKIFFTCHNIALANVLKNRIPDFFTFMKVEKQIKWNELLWVDRAWGSQSDKNSGLYSYICDFYNIPFMRFTKYPLVTYEKIFKSALEKIDEIEPNQFKYAFDYILIDERQDFPDIFFELCKKITRKQVYIAGDIFQDIFDNNIEKRVTKVDFILNRCYRTDPRILMFAHSIGMGLFEDKKLNWLTDKEWKASGYNIERNDNRNICLSRESIRRFEDLEMENISTMNIDKYENISQVIDIIKYIREKNPTVQPDDIAIIILDTHKTIYKYIDKLEYEIITQIKWDINRAFNSKERIDNRIFISNRNNAKGLEFPFVICITAKILDDYSYRNTLYTMLTRSFIQSFLLVKNDRNLDIQKNGLEVIKTKKCIKTIEPTEQEKQEIKNTIIRVREENAMSFKDFLYQIFEECKVNDLETKQYLENMLNASPLRGTFDKEKITDFVLKNIDILYG